MTISGLRYKHQSHENRWSAFGHAQVRYVIYILRFSENSELMRIHNYLMIFLKIIFMELLLYWAVVLSSSKEERVRGWLTAGGDSRL